MAACESVTDDQPSLKWREVDDFLHYWGSARWRVGLAGGFPGQSAIASQVELYEPREWFQVKQITAQGRQTPYYGGHRILCEDCFNVSPLLLAINMAVNMLPEPQFKAIVVKYAVGVVRGQDYSAKQQAEMLEITPDALSERLRRARKSLGRMLVNFSRRRY